MKTSVIKHIEKYISCPVQDIEQQPNTWYRIIKKTDVQSSRYNIGFFQLGFRIKAILHDFKLAKNYVFYIKQSKFNLELSKKVVLDSPYIKHERTHELFDIGINKDNGYLKKKGLHIFSGEYFNIRCIDYGTLKNVLLIPYTNFELFPEFCGGRLIKADGDKLSVKGSKLKNAFHAHRYVKDIANFIIGEGFPECCIAASLFTDFNILEAGPAANVGNLVSILSKNINNNIYVLGENDSKTYYTELQDTYANIRVSYPPDTECKDFNDYFIKHDLTLTQEAMLGLLTGEQELGYKPLGIDNTEIVFYSKVINSIVCTEPSKTENIHRLTTKSITEAHNTKITQKKAHVNRIFLECAKIGSYRINETKPIGLWRSPDNKHYYNDGTRLYEVLKEDIKLVSYSDVIKYNFLPYRVPGYNFLDYTSKFTAQTELEDILSRCDWDEEIYVKILLGFLVQSCYAGIAEFRPHLWLMSKSSYAGKSWLSNWISSYIIPVVFNREAGRSTSAGTAQAMTKLAGLCVADEFAEKGTIYKKEAIQFIELLRSAATAQKPVVMGQPNQKPLYGHIKFSALLTCINGTELLEEQDFYRIIYIYLNKKKGFFEQDIKPLFSNFIDKGKHKGFMLHAIKGAYLYKRLYHKYLIQLVKLYPDIGHRVRGLAAILSGYAIYYRDENKGAELLVMLKHSIIVKPFDIRVYEDVVERILSTTISGLYVNFVENKYETVLTFLLQMHVINGLGIKLSGKRLFIYTSEFANFNDRYLKFRISELYGAFRSSKYMEKESNTFFNKKKTKYFIFNLEGLLGD